MPAQFAGNQYYANAGQNPYYEPQQQQYPQYPQYPQQPQQQPPPPQQYPRPSAVQQPVNGADGSPGAQGLPGPAGPQGPVGLQGPPGRHGPTVMSWQGCQELDGVDASARVGEIPFNSQLHTLRHVDVVIIGSGEAQIAVLAGDDVIGTGPRDVTAPFTTISTFSEIPSKAILSVKVSAITNESPIITSATFTM